MDFLSLDIILIILFLTKIIFCHKCLIGGDPSSYQPVLPFKIPETIFDELIKSDSPQSALVRACYRLNGDGSYHLEGDDKWYGNT